MSVVVRRYVLLYSYLEVIYFILQEVVSGSCKAFFLHTTEIAQNTDIFRAFLKLRVLYSQEVRPRITPGKLFNNAPADTPGLVSADGYAYPCF